MSSDIIHAKSFDEFVRNYYKDKQMQGTEYGQGMYLAKDTKEKINRRIRALLPSNYYLIEDEDEKTTCIYTDRDRPLITPQIVKYVVKEMRKVEPDFNMELTESDIVRLIGSNPKELPPLGKKAYAILEDKLCLSGRVSIYSEFNDEIAGFWKLILDLTDTFREKSFKKYKWECVDYEEKLQFFNALKRLNKRYPHIWTFSNVAMYEIKCRLLNPVMYSTWSRINRLAGIEAEQYMNVELDGKNLKKVLVGLEVLEDIFFPEENDIDSYSEGLHWDDTKTEEENIAAIENHIF